MLRILGVIVALVFATFIIFVSIIKSSSPNFAFYQIAPSSQHSSFNSGIEYYFPAEGIGPDHRLWPIKALRDKAWLAGTRDYSRRAELLLLFADKRLKMAEDLSEKGEAELAVTTAIKAEQYLQEAYDAQKFAREYGADTTGFVQRLAGAALKHREILEKIMQNSPGDAQPVFIETLNFPKNVYERCVQDLNEKGALAPSPLPKVSE